MQSIDQIRSAYQHTDSIYEPGRTVAILLDEIDRLTEELYVAQAELQERRGEYHGDAQTSITKYRLMIREQFKKERELK